MEQHRTSSAVPGEEEGAVPIPPGSVGGGTDEARASAAEDGETPAAPATETAFAASLSPTAPQGESASPGAEPVLEFHPSGVERETASSDGLDPVPINGADAAERAVPASEPQVPVEARRFSEAPPASEAPAWNAAPSIAEAPTGAEAPVVAETEETADPAVEQHLEVSPTAVPAAPVAVPAEAAVPVDRHESAASEEGQPNWMLAFVCAWAGGTSLYEAYQFAALAAPAFSLQVLRGPTFLGYALLGVGLLIFAWDALQWGKHRRRGALLAALLLPTLLTLAGAVFLLISHEPGRRI